jgi:enoyl-CoA hydratase/carnithine racemase
LSQEAGKSQQASKSRDVGESQDDPKSREDPGYEHIRFELDDGVAVLTLNRPDQLNAFSGKMGKELAHAYRRCDADDAVRAVILTGAGRAFCAGADMSAGADTFAKQDDEAFSAAAVDVPAWEVRKPVIAAMNGHAVGLGLTLALQCDLRIAADEGKYGVLQVRRGVMPDAYSHWTLPRIVGMERAASLLLTGRKITGREAEQMGLVLRSVPSAEVLPNAMEIARDIAHNTAPLSVAITKRLLWQSPDLTPEQVEHLETELHHVLMGAPDAIEGAVAYLERRKPNWSATVSRDWPEWPDTPDKP